MSDRLLAAPAVAAQSIVVALPWQYGSIVVVGRDNTADDLESDMQGRVLPPGAETLEAWLRYIDVALEENWSLDGGWSPCRSLDVLWPDGKHRYYKAEFSTQAFDIEIADSAPEQNCFVVADEVAKFRNMSHKHVFFINTCLFRFRHASTAHIEEEECARRSRSFMKFIQDECMEHILCALALLAMCHIQAQLVDDPTDLELGFLLVGRRALAAQSIST